MDSLVLLCIVFVTFTGLTKGAGVLPDGPLNAAVGGSVMFNTTLTTEKPFLFVRWWINGTEPPIVYYSPTENITAPEYEGRITLFTSTGSLELRSLTVKDTGEYTVSITLSGGAQHEGNTELVVHEPVSNVEVTANSTDLVEFNSSVRLSCSSSGSSLSYLWMNSSSEVIASDRVQLTDVGSTLTILNVTRYDQGPYECRVSSPVSNNISEPINLFISYGPGNINLTRSPPREHYEQGSDIDLICSAVSRPSALFYWFLNGDRLSDTGPEISLINIQMSQSGNYCCQAFNSKTLRYETSQQSAVSVLERISNAVIISSTKVPIEGKSINLTCDAAGSVFTRQWMKDGSDLILDGNIMLHDNNRVLSFHPLKQTDSGEYSCKISNPISTEEAKYTLIVNYGPENVQITGPSEIEEKQTLTLMCSADSTPSASYSWTLNGTNIHISAVFTKHNTELSDSGTYTCEVSNIISGRTSSAVHKLTVKGVPVKSPGGLSAGAIAGITIMICFIFAVVAAGGYFIYKKKVNNNPQTNNKEQEHVYENTSNIYENK